MSLPAAVPSRSLQGVSKLQLTQDEKFMDKFQRKSVTLAVAGVFGGLLAAGAQAQYLAENASSLSNVTVVRLAGASAQDLGLRNVLRRICVPGTLTQYVTSNQNAYLCTPNASQVTGLPGNLLVYKTSVGGSGTGVGPVAAGSNLLFTNLPAMFAAGIGATCAEPVVSAAIPGVLPDTLGLPQFRTRTCTSVLTANGVADAGLSDVEPALLPGGATPAQVASLNARGTNQLVFGVPVTLAMYRGLQAAQFLGQDDTAANVPSLSKAQIAQIFTGTIVDSSQLSGPTGVALPSNPLVVSHRVPTSGSQAITEVFFLNLRCTPAAQEFAQPDVTYGNDGLAYAGCASGNFFRVANSGTSQVIACLRGADSAGFWGIGNISTESVPSLTATDGQWRYIKVDGHAPTILNAALGNYLFVAEQSMQWVNSFTEASAGARFRVANYIRTNLGNPVVIASLNGTFGQLFGQAGLLGVPNGGSISPPPAPLTEAAMVARPVNTWSKSNVTALANCTFPQIVTSQQTFPN